MKLIGTFIILGLLATINIAQQTQQDYAENYGGNTQRNDSIIQQDVANSKFLIQG